MIFLLVAQLFLSPAHAAESCAPAALAALSEADGQAHQSGVRLSDMSWMGLENARDYLRKVAKLVQGCPDRAFYRRVIASLNDFGYPTRFLPYMFGPNLTQAGLAEYQIGSTWDKIEYTPAQTDPTVQKLFNAVAIMGFDSGEPGLHLHSVGTGFYLGRFGGRHFVGTALHVFADNEKNISAEEACRTFTFHFPSHGQVKYAGGELVGQWRDLDLAICALTVKPEEEARFAGKELRFDFSPIALNEPFATMGFNFKNPKPGRPYFDDSADCRLFLDHPAKQDGRWSMPVGCDVAGGDSGSPLVNRASGRIRGFMWGTTEIKAAYSSTELTAFQKNPSRAQVLWDELAQAVPAPKIAEALCAPDHEWNRDFCAAQRP